MYLSNIIYNTPLATQVALAAHTWKAKFGGTPRVILCHPADVPIFRDIDAYQVIGRPYMVRGRYWIGVQA